MNKDSADCKDLAKTKSKYLSRNKMKESVESLPKQDLFERIYKWLENNDNEITFVEEESDSSSTNGNEEAFFKV